MATVTIARPASRSANLLVLLGSLVTRWTIVRAGQSSADDPQAAFAYHR